MYIYTNIETHTKTYKSIQKDIETLTTYKHTEHIENNKNFRTEHIKTQKNIRKQIKHTNAYKNKEQHIKTYKTQTQHKNNIYIYIETATKKIYIYIYTNIEKHTKASKTYKHIQQPTITSKHI